MVNLNHIDYLYILKRKPKEVKKGRGGFPARHDPDDHPPTNFGSKGNRTQACGSLRWQPCKLVIALNYCTTRVTAGNNLNFI